MRAYQALQSNQIAKAFASFQHLVQTDPKLAAAWNGLGMCEERVGRLEAACRAYQQAVALDSHEAEFLNNWGVCSLTSGRTEAAVSAFQQLLLLKPDFESRYNYALALTHARDFTEAIQQLGVLINEKPGWDLPQMQLFVIMRFFAYDPLAASFLQQQLQSEPEQAFPYLCLAIYHDERQDQDLSIRYYRMALRRDTHLFEAYRGLISLLQTRGNYPYALELATRLHEIENSPRSVSEVLTSLQNPIVASLAEIDALQRRISDILDYFLNHRQEFEYLKSESRSRPHILNFYHMYHGGNDRPLQEKLAAFHQASLPERQFLRPTTHVRPRIGIVSLRFCDHSVMHLLQRAIETLLSAGDFESFVYFIHHPPTSRIDEVTHRIEGLSDHFSHLAEHYLEAAEQIAQDQLDILIYPDLGMDSLTYTLALFRLAPYQLVLPGHPVTTGMPSVDYFISAQTLEPAGSEQYYTEKLIRLPGLPDYQAVVIPELASREDLDLPEGNLYFCPMTTFKVHPEFDDLVAQILRRDPDAQVLFLQFKNQLHLKLQARFQTTIPDFYERIHFLHWSNREIFFQRLMTVDVILDTFYFGGGNTAYQAFGLGCPIVCRGDLPWSKGRWTQAMYQLMEIPELIAQSKADYVDLVVRLALDKVWQAELREKVKTRNQVLFDNPTWSQGLLEFCRLLLKKNPPAL